MLIASDRGRVDAIKVGQAEFEIRFRVQQVYDNKLLFGQYGQCYGHRLIALLLLLLFLFLLLLMLMLIFLSTTSALVASTTTSRGFGTSA